MSCVIRGGIFTCMVGLCTGASSAEVVSIEHKAVGCVVAERFPTFEARFAPTDQVAQARLWFRPAGGVHWYSVAMKPEGPQFAGVLPRPKKALKMFAYYIEVTAKDLSVSRTGEHGPAVVAGPGACKDAWLAPTLASAAVGLEAPAGAPLVPAGFSPAGVTAVGAAGAGISGTTLALVGGGLAAAGVGVAAAGGGESAQPPPASPPVTGNLTGSTEPWSYTLTNLVTGCVNRGDFPACTVQVTLTDTSGQAIIVCGPHPWVNLSGPREICDPPDKIPMPAQTLTFSPLTVSGANVTGVTFSAAHQTLTLQATRDTSTLKGTITWNGATATPPDLRYSGGQQPFTASKP